MTLTDYQRRQCLKVVDKILEYRISSMFSQPVNTEFVPTYLQVISRPMDLGTVRQKIINNEYNTVEQWKADVELVWENAFTFNGRQSVIALLAKHLQNMFKEMTDSMTMNEIGDWAAKTEELKAEIDKITKSGPKPTPSKAKKKAMASKISRQHSVPLPQMTRQESYPSYEPIRPPPPPPPPPQPQPQKEAPQQEFSSEEILKLTNDVNSLENQQQVQQVIDLIRENEPQLAIGEEVEIEVSKLHSSTLRALRSLVTKFLNQ